ncbi:MAG: hypothetical protein H6744_17125 [Deltaproteobacteria bacterium]|nr:hypothetical protein [Deltaproteobacteria bacterium]MCB9788406.1 hypothetical protein [Deltaproteobacteria bacterium]
MQLIHARRAISTLAVLLAAACAPAALAAPTPIAREFRFQKVDTKGVEGEDRAMLAGEEVWGAPCFFEAEAFHDTKAFALLVHVKDGVRQAYVGGLTTPLAPFDFSALAEGGRPVLEPEGASIQCVRLATSQRMGAIVVPYRLEQERKPRYALIRVKLLGQQAPEAVLVGAYGSNAEAIREAANVIPQWDDRLPAPWFGFLKPKLAEVCLRTDCPR